VPEVLLRDRREEDRDALFAHQADPASAAMAAVPTRDRAAFDAHWDAPDPAARRWVVEAGGRLVGEVLTFVRDGEREVGYRIGREHWGRGYATAALRALLELLPERPLTAKVAEHNMASLRVLERCGFERVGERQDGGVRLVVLRLG
jgi:RimJ/RimL family protein N-acetyltransferase